MDEKYYTEIKAGVLQQLNVNILDKTYKVIENVDELDLDFETVDFLPLEIYNALISGLNLNGYIKK